MILFLLLNAGNYVRQLRRSLPLVCSHWPGPPPILIAHHGAPEALLAELRALVGLVFRKNSQLVSVQPLQMFYSL